MTLRDLLTSLDVAWARPAAATLPDETLARPVRAIAYDSRRVIPGTVFVAWRGQVHDGVQFVPQAVSRGAIAIVAEAAPVTPQAVPWIVVPGARLALATLADAFYGHPSRAMSVVGITGTNGKTTTAWLLGAVLEACGIRAGVIGTVAYRFGQDERPALRTTPEAPDVQQLLREMVDAGCGACAMEVSSHALVLERVERTRFQIGVFTNLTRDHLDFHGDMEAYFLAKRRLFERLDRTSGVAVVNVDDPRGTAMAAPAPRVLTYGIAHDADVTPGPVSISLDGLAFAVHTPGGAVDIRTELVGRPNVYNILAAVGAGVALGLPLEGISRGLASVSGVPGRFQIVSTPTDRITVVVDYAHTDDALRNLLETARPLAGRRLITVFGCGGDRDRTKRPLMGAVAVRLSDVVIVTSDNPRTEDPHAIIAEIRRGIPAEALHANGHSRACLEIADRRAAIDRAIRLAEPGDLVVIAGKGHESYQIIGEKVLPFDDAAVAREVLDRRCHEADARGGAP